MGNNDFPLFQLSDGFEFGQASVETFKEDCKNVLIKNPDPELPNIFCPNDCSGNGKWFYLASAAN